MWIPKESGSQTNLGGESGKVAPSRAKPDANLASVRAPATERFTCGPRSPGKGGSKASPFIPNHIAFGCGAIM